MLVRICCQCSKILGFKARIPFYKTFTEPIEITHGLCDRCLDVWCQIEDKKRNIKRFGNLSVQDMVFHLIQRDIRKARGLKHE